jgi:hypothetical protein
MARPEELVHGKCYFQVVYSDEQLLIPKVLTLLYERCEESAQTEDGTDFGRHWLFRCCELSAETETDPLMGITDDQLYSVLDFPGLLAVLEELAADPFHAIQPWNAPLATISDFADLRHQVPRFLEDLDFVSLTITIKFREQGLTLSRCDHDGLEMTFFPRPRRDREEPRIRRFFLDLGIKAHEDYLADRGRMRVLSFSIPAACLPLDQLVNLCTRVFIEVYAMRAGEPLKYSFLSRGDLGAQGAAQK